MKLIVPETIEMEFENSPWQVGRYSEVYRETLRNKLVPEEDIIIANEADMDNLMQVHTKEYLDKVLNYTMNQEEQDRLELPLNSFYVKLMSCFCQGSIFASFHALNDGIAVHLGGGMHHAFSAWGEGFCIFNDVAVAIRTLQILEQEIISALVIDCDVHQGNGTASIFKNYPDVFTFSIQMKSGYPYHRPPSDLDINLSDNTGDDVYLEKLQQGLDSIFEQDPIFDLAIYIAGADPYIGDPLAVLDLSIEGLRQRDELVISTLRKKGIPTAITFGGGYSDASTIAKINCNTIKTALKYA
jgi:acetoin utilization deacetylase AcuC-like enzyme